MFKRFCSVLIVFLAVVLSSQVGSEPNIKEGLWEITTKTNVPGMPMPPVTHTQCLTQKDLVPQASQPGQECKLTSQKISGNKVSWAIKCNAQGGEMKGTGEVTYSGDTFEGTMVMTIPQAGMNMTYVMKGRRIGPCK